MGGVMTHFVTDIVLIIGLMFLARSHFRKRRSATTRTELLKRQERSDLAPVRREYLVSRRANAAVTPASAPDTSIAPPAYLLGRAVGRGGVDRTAAMMDLMSGPGLCSPRDR
jgi:hypothetical protein